MNATDARVNTRNGWALGVEGVDPDEDKHKRRNTGVAKSVKEIAESNTAILEQLRSPNATEVAMQRFIIIIIIIIQVHSVHNSDPALR